MESLIGKINHDAHIILLERYSLISLWQLLNRSNKWVLQRLLACYRDELKLWTRFLWRLTKWEVPINNITFDKPAVKLWSTNGNIMGFHDLPIPAQSHSTTIVIVVRINIISGHRQDYSVNLIQGRINRWVHQWHNYTNNLKSNVHLEGWELSLTGDPHNITTDSVLGSP